MGVARSQQLRKWWQSALFIVLTVAMAACSSTKHVPNGKYLLDNVKINVHDEHNGIKSKELQKYLRQTPNHKVLWGVKLQLAIYNMSGKDSTKWYNKWIRKVGSPPVIYDSTLTEASVKQLSTAIVNKGFMHATVGHNTELLPEKKKANVTYDITLNQPHYIASIQYNIPDDTIRNIILADTNNFVIKRNEPFDLNVLNQQRTDITERLRNHGYYAFNKECITFTADTALNQRDVILTMNLMEPQKNDRMPFYTSHKPFYVRSVSVITNYDPVTMAEGKYFAADTTMYRDYRIFYDEKRYLKPDVIYETCFIEPGKIYNAADVSKTYQSFGRLGIVKFVNIEFAPVGEVDGKIWLDAYVLLSPGKKQSISLSLEGTNSDGDLGFAVGANYQHRNAFKGSELLSTKFRVSYESLSGNLSQLINDHYSEYSGEVGITFPKFKFPFLKKSFKKKVLASTMFASNFNFQQRPEYTRIIAGASWKYIWSLSNNQKRHTYTLMDVNYVYLPASKNHFLDSIKNPLLRYSFENHLIMRMGYSFYRTNKPAASLTGQRFLSNVYTFRAMVETAGNFLYGMSNLFKQKRSPEGLYKIFGINYSQYAKFDADYSFTHYFNARHSIALHAGMGVAVPYGNSGVLPFEKRFYSGGANSVRGWGVRTLGPGSYNGSNEVNKFIYQCGDIRLDMNVEYRAKLFWVIESALFIDAGNIWTIQDYEDQRGGVFKFNKFYKQIALAYGAGIRLDFTYFLLRLDLGMKAHNPAENQVKWPLVSPNWKRDATFHFAIGYPF